MKKPEVEQIYPLSPMQEGLLFESLATPDESAYFDQMAFRVSGPFQLETFIQSCRELGRRHAVLRTVFVVEEASRPLQIVFKEKDFEILSEDVTHLPSIEQERYLKNYLRKDRARSFDLTSEILMRIGIFRLGEESHQIVWSQHHILMDGWCTELLYQDLIRIYECLCRGEMPNFPKPRPYSDYIQWLEARKTDEAKAYWSRYLSDYEQLVSLPAYGAVRKELEYKTEELMFSFSAETSNGLRTLATQEAVTLSTLFQLIWGILLARYNNTNDVLFGMIVSGRPAEITGIEEMIGLFINAVPVRIRWKPDQGFLELLKQLQQEALEAEVYHFVPLAEIQTECSDLRLLFDHLLVFQNYALTPQDRQSGENTLFSLDHVEMYERTHYDCNVLIIPGEQIGIKFIYNGNVYHRDQLEGIGNHLKTVVEAIIADPLVRMDAIDILPPSERQRVLEEFNHTITAYPAEQTIVDMFEAQVEKTPEAVALVAGSQQWRFRELNACANQLANLLREKGLGPNRIASVFCDRSPDVILSMLGILKAGGAYLPIDPRYPEERMLAMLNDSGAVCLLTQSKMIKHSAFTALQNLQTSHVRPVVTRPRASIRDLDSIPKPDRSLVSYKQYHQHVGIAPVKHTVALQLSRGCPFNCLYCHKIWPKKQISRSAEDILDEIQVCYNAGVKRFVLVDDIFNFDTRNTKHLLQNIIKAGLKIQLFLPNGLRGDILTPEYIDLLVEAGTVNIDVALESASPRIQNLIRKHLNLDKFRKNVEYLTTNYPQVILEMELMLGFPTETEEEALLTLDFLQDFNWVHFPNVNILKIFPNTEMEAFAIEQGISKETVERSANLAFHELPDTLPFSKSFVRQYQAKFMNEYFLRKERLLQVLPKQIEMWTEDELVQKYNSYLPVEITDFADLLNFAELTEAELDGVTPLQDDVMAAPDFDEKIRAYFPQEEKAEDAFRVLLLDLSLLFSGETEQMLYDMIEAPLGLMSLLTYLNATFGKEVNGRIAKSRIDFDNVDELHALLQEVRPQVIGIRTLSFYKNFFHKTVSLLKTWYPDIPILTGGPYATSEYDTILADKNVDVAVLGEGELTFAELIGAMMKAGGKLPPENELERIAGLAFVPNPGTPASLPAEQAGWRPAIPGVSETSETTREILMLDRIQAEMDRKESGNPAKVHTATDLSYIIYTSGSTGRPKGVMQTHRCVSNLIQWQLDQIGGGWRILQYASLGFDASMQETLFSLVSGNTLYVIPEEMRYDMPTLAEFLAEHRIELFIMPFSPLHLLFQEDTLIKKNPALRHIITAGEVLQMFPELQSYLKTHPEVQLHNQYGPTETHVVTAYTLTGDQGTLSEFPPIGRPIANTEILILDNAFRPVPIGVTGEIFAAGAGLARGYLNRDDLTAERFLAHPFKKGELMYRTGDVGRWLPDGNIEFLGRNDDQVKIRGFRVEPGEIANRLLQHKMVKEAVVLAKQLNGNKELVAYVSPSNGKLDVAEIREYLKSTLPDYMVPSYFVPLKEFPHTSSGKIDRKALPEPGERIMEQGTSYNAPRDELEKKLAVIWQEILGIRKAGIRENFFDLGGHSLKATRVVSRIHKELSSELSLGEFLDQPTIEALAQRIRKKDASTYTSIEKTQETEDYPLSHAQRRLWVLDQMEGGSAAYNMPGALLLQGSLDRKALERSFTELVQRHEALRTIFIAPDGEPRQKILSPDRFQLSFIDFSQRAGAEEKIRTFGQQDAETPFDLRTELPFRVTVAKEAEDRHVLFVNLHHIVADGWSMNILVREMCSLYNAFTQQQPSPLKPLRIQYKDYAVWQKQLLKSSEIEASRTYWHQKLEGELPLLKLIEDFPRPTVQTFRGDWVEFTLSPERIKQLRAFAREREAGLFVTLLAIVKVLLYRYSGQEDILVGSPIAGRDHADLEDQIGFYVNTLALRGRISGNASFESLLQEIDRSASEAYEHQRYPFDRLVEELEIKRIPGRSAMFDVMVILQNNEPMEFSLQNLQISLFKQQQQISRFDLVFMFSEAEHELKGEITYNSDIFRKERIQGMQEHFLSLLESILNDPQQTVDRLKMLSETEREQLLEMGKQTQNPAPDIDEEQLDNLSDEEVAALLKEMLKT
ncbi:MAG: amino acid adenylation domain-containing protein [bacterium]|nr:amino acid adenylation domain-containing protein [bacterium]